MYPSRRRHREMAEGDNDADKSDDGEAAAANDMEDDDDDENDNASETSTALTEPTKMMVVTVSRGNRACVVYIIANVFILLLSYLIYSLLDWYGIITAVSTM